MIPLLSLCLAAAGFPAKTGPASFSPPDDVEVEPGVEKEEAFLQQALEAVWTENPWGGTRHLVIARQGRVLTDEELEDLDVPPPQTPARGPLRDHPLRHVAAATLLLFAPMLPVLGGGTAMFGVGVVMWALAVPSFLSRVSEGSGAPASAFQTDFFAFALYVVAIATPAGCVGALPGAAGSLMLALGVAVVEGNLEHLVFLGGKKGVPHPHETFVTEHNRELAQKLGVDPGHFPRRKYFPAD